MRGKYRSGKISFSESLVLKGRYKDSQSREVMDKILI